MRITLSISLLCMLNATYAQTNSFVDVFPLAVGNEWTYRYNSTVINALNETTTEDTGRATYRITNVQRTPDSTRWFFTQHRNLVRTWWSLGGGRTVTQVVDTSTFELVERNAGRHQLYRLEHYYIIIQSVFPFTVSHTDTTAVYRYQRVDSAGMATFLSRPCSTPTPPCPRSVFTFVQGTGESRYEYAGGPLTGVIYHVDHRLLGSVLLSANDQIRNGLPDEFKLWQN